jgi:hypothetical protein
MERSGTFRFWLVRGAEREKEGLRWGAEEKREETVGVSAAE